MFNWRLFFFRYLGITLNDTEEPVVPIQKENGKYVWTLYLMFSNDAL